MKLLALVVALAACGGGTAAPTSSSSAAQPPSTVPAAMPPQSAMPGVYAKACETECADDMAQLVTYRDASGALAIVTVQGSPARCSHPPLRFLGPDGTERAAIPMQPVVLGSPEAAHFDAIRQSQIGGLTRAETMRCRDVKH